jgi:hypothetical protein
MAQLDRFLSVMVANNAESILLIESDVATLQKDGVARPITRQPLTAQQLLALLREIAPERAAAELAAGTPTSFDYISDDGAFAVTTALTGGRWHATIAIGASNGDGTAESNGDDSTDFDNIGADVEPHRMVVGRRRATTGA